MVSTRNHPRAFPPPSPASPASPTKSSRASSAETALSTRPVSELRGAWAHTPSNFTIIWLAISLPLVIWDTAYVFLRPHSMAGGKYQWPLWQPYDLYATVDYIYGWPAYERNDGFTAAQASMNVIETAGYLFYLWVLYRHGKQENVDGRGALSKKRMGWLAQSQALHGEWAAYAVLVLYGVSLMTVSKTVLYWLNEACSGFQNIGHNDLYSLIFLWIIPNGAWIIVPAYMTVVSGREILQGLLMASRGDAKQE